MNQQMDVIGQQDRGSRFHTDSTAKAHRIEAKDFTQMNGFNIMTSDDEGSDEGSEYAEFRL